jgi:hypothetical protein
MPAALVTIAISALMPAQRRIASTRDAPQPLTESTPRTRRRSSRTPTPNRDILVKFCRNLIHASRSRQRDPPTATPFA